MERLFQVIVENWWFIANLGVFVIAIGAPFFAVAIKALGMKGEMEKQGFYPDSLMVRCVIDHPVKVVAAMGIIQILGALAIGMLA